MNIEKLRTHISYDPSTGIMTWKKVLSNRGVVGAECGSNVDSKVINAYALRVNSTEHIVLSGLCIMAKYPRFK